MCGEGGAAADAAADAAAEDGTAAAARRWEARAGAPCAANAGRADGGGGAHRWRRWAMEEAPDDRQLDRTRCGLR